MRYYGLVLTLVILAFLGNISTFFLFFVSDFWERPLSAQATSEASLSLVIISNTSSSSTTSTTTTTGGTGGGGGGGGGGVVAPSVSFVVDPEELNLFLVAGAFEEKKITVANTGRSAIRVILNVTGVSSFVAVDATELTLSPGESKNVIIRVKAPDSGIYGGRVSFTSGGVRKDVILLINVRSANALFDVSLTIPESFKNLGLGRLLKTFISLLQVGPAEDTDVVVNYLIKDFDGATLLTETETFRVFRSKTYVKEFDTRSLPEGDYLAGIEVTYPQGFATSSSHFSVSKKAFNYLILVLILVLVISLVILFYSFRTYRRAKQLRARPALSSRRRA
ncbi:MAG TPA: hypothetical protein VJK07_01500 [Candidatus Nanoarchaeia archaeon]|nr:hypothetical protein [Candidatus Nanoarchaeia archaeon]